MKIVVVEDSLTVRQELLDRLSEEQFLTVVGQASTSAEAIATVRLSKPDVVLLDLTLRDGASGVEVLQELRNGGYAGRIYILTASAYEFTAFDCKARGANGFYNKSEGLDRLVEDLSELALGSHVELLRSMRAIDA